jgi:hypothetical protein
MVRVRQGGGSIEDALRASGVIGPGTHIVGGRGSNSSSYPPEKKWWQFWK